MKTSIDFFLTNDEIKNHDIAFNNKLRKNNLPLFLSMQIVYLNSLRNFIEKAEKANPIINELLIKQENMINILKEKYRVKFPKSINVFDNKIDTNIFIDSELERSIRRFLKWYIKRSKLYNISKTNRIDLIYVF